MCTSKTHCGNLAEAIAKRVRRIFLLAAKQSRLLALALALCFGCLPSVQALRPSIEPLNRVETLPTSPVETRTGVFVLVRVDRLSFGDDLSPETATGWIVFVYKSAPGQDDWLNGDPLREGGGINLYQFCGGDPINFVDPYGDSAAEVQQWIAGKAETVKSALTVNGTGGVSVGVNTAVWSVIDFGVSITEPLLLGDSAGQIAATGGSASDYAWVAADELSRGLSLTGGGGAAAGSLRKIVRTEQKVAQSMLASRVAKDAELIAVPEGPGAMTRLRYEANPKHASTQRGRASPAPFDGQGSLDGSISYNPNSTARVGLDSDGIPVVFRQHTDGVFHGYKVPFEELETAQRNALIENGFVNRKGKVILP